MVASAPIKEEALSGSDIVLSVPEPGDLHYIARWMTAGCYLPARQRLRMMADLVEQLSDAPMMQATHARIGMHHGERIFFVEIVGGTDVYLCGPASLLNIPENALACWTVALAYVREVLGHGRFRVVLGDERKVERAVLRGLL